MGLISSILVDENNRLLIAELSEDYVFRVNLPHQPSIANTIMFKQVSRDFSCDNLRDFYDSLRESIGKRASIVFLTAADVRDYIWIREEDFEVIATVGLEPPVCPGSYRDTRGMGTINIAVLVKQGLSDAGLLDLFKTVVEAKSLAMVDLNLRCDNRSPGTATDAIAVGRPLRIVSSQDFAGMATSLGNRISRAIYTSLVSKGVSRLGLEEFIYNAIGLKLEDIIDLVLRVYSRAPIPNVSESIIKTHVKNIARSVFSDPNVQALMLAARELDLHASIGSIPNITVDDFKSDSVKIVADELLASALSLYIAGFKGLLATYWVERLKELGVIRSDLPVFEDDILSAIIGSILTLLYDKFIVRM